MTDDLMLAFRNLRRNLRRSISTGLAITLACAGLVLFGGYIIWAHVAGEGHATSMFGSLQVFREGFHESGGGNPAEYAIEDYEGLRKRLLEDGELEGKLALVTGQLVFNGLVQSEDYGTSAPCLGLGLVPGDLEFMTGWNPHGLADVRELEVNRQLFSGGPELSEDHPDGGAVGIGLARILGFGPGWLEPGERPMVEVISLPPGGGLPNVMSMEVRRSCARGLDVIDNSQVVVPLEFASELLFPGEPLRVTSVVVIVNDHAELDAVVARIREIGRAEGLGIEVLTGTEMHPTYKRSVAMMDMFFLFSFLIIAVVLVFLIFNTMSMNIIERTSEVGVLRTMGMRRGRVVRMLVTEGAVLGGVGALGGLVLGVLVAWAVNSAEITYLPPTVPFHAKLEVLVANQPWLLIASGGACVAAAILASVLPAMRAARMEVVEALRQ